jgi:DeoR/GlpR family transcriptional regulator of sugar metabolism
MVKQLKADAPWTFLTNHAHVLLCIASTPDARVRDIAERVGITERAVQRILTDLDAGGYVSRVRAGRRTEYGEIPDLPLRHPIESHCSVRQLVTMMQAPRRGRK